jgi:hypothetical protein
MVTAVLDTPLQKGTYMIGLLHYKKQAFTMKAPQASVAVVWPVVLTEVAPLLAREYARPADMFRLSLNIRKDPAATRRIAV